MRRLRILASGLPLAGALLLNAQTPSSERVSARLWDLVNGVPAPITGPPVMTASGPQSALLESALLPLKDGQVLISAIAEDDPEVLAAELAAVGAQDCAVAGRVVSAHLPVAAIPSLAGLSQLRFARSGLAFANAGSVTSQADVALRANTARATYHVTGAGIRVGILSDSFNALGGMDDGKATDDLPQDILIISDVTGTTDEGRAMGEIVHDVAPGATLAFHTAWNGEADFAQGIRRLRDQGCRVIVDDVIYLEEPMFADGIIAQAVDEVAASGVAYFSAAGNAGRNSYESTFRNDGQGYHDFNSGSGTDTILDVNLFSGYTWFVLQWPDRYASTAPDNPGAATDLDIELVYPDGRSMSGLGGFNNNVGGDPVEVFGVQVTGFGLPAGLRIRLKTGAAPPLVKLVWYPQSILGQGEYYTDSSTIYAHMNARGAMCTGAVRYCRTPAFGQNPPLLEGWSSMGGTPIYFAPDGTPAFEVRQKPDFCAPQGGDNTFFGADSDCSSLTGFPNFLGTSAAAPHAAAVAALMLEARSDSPPLRICTVLQQTAIDMETAGFDHRSGYGLIQADTALARLTLPAPVLQRVVSRRTQGSAGTFDINLPLTAPFGIECRQGSSLRLVFAFDRSLVAATPVVLEGSAAVSAVQVQGAEVRVDLSNVADSQWLKIGLTEIADTSGGYLAAAAVTCAIFSGDVNGNGYLTSGDLSAVRQAIGAGVNGNNFRCDTTANGLLTSGDLSAIRLRIGTLLPVRTF